VQVASWAAAIGHRGDFSTVLHAPKGSTECQTKKAFERADGCTESGVGIGSQNSPRASATRGYGSLSIGALNQQGQPVSTRRRGLGRLAAQGSTGSVRKGEFVRNGRSKLLYLDTFRAARPSTLPCGTGTKQVRQYVNHALRNKPKPRLLIP
jgi:hypothetical protein